MIGIDQHDAIFNKVFAQFAPTPLLIRSEAAHFFADHLQLFGGAPAILRNDSHSLPHLAAQARHTHHEEFIEIVGGDRQEAELFKQWMVAIARFFQDAAIELQPRQFAIDETVRARHQAQQFVGMRACCFSA